MEYNDHNGLWPIGILMCAIPLLIIIFLIIEGPPKHWVKDWHSRAKGVVMSRTCLDNPDLEKCRKAKVKLEKYEKIYKFSEK